MHRTVSTLCLAIALTSWMGIAIATAEEPTRTVESLLAEARDAQSRRDFNAAAESYRKATILEPSVPELWANLGLMYHESGKPVEAMRSFKEAIRLNASLFVPQLFVGLEYLEARNPEAAAPFLEKAENLNPNDVQAALNLGKAYALLNHADRAADAYSKAARLAPTNGDIWLSLGTAYLQQVEDDARLMVSEYSHSAYSNLRAAETFAEEGKLVQAGDSYKAAIASGPVPCMHAEFGITLLREEKVAEAHDQFELEAKARYHCGLASLGEAVAQLAQGHREIALTSLTALAETDPGFVASNLPLLRSAVSADQINSLTNLALAQPDDAARSVNISSLIERAFASPDAPLTPASADVQPSGTLALSNAYAESLYASGEYAKCSEALRPTLRSISSDQLQVLASCSFYAGDFETASKAAQHLKSNTASRVQGLYWESKADQKLAIGALLRAGEIDADSPRMHVLLGDIFRQARNWGDAEAEYRKAVALDAKSHSGRLSLAIALFSELKIDEALEVDANLLAEDPNDPEANLLAGEILVQRNLYAEAEHYLDKCRNLKPEFLPRLHVLLGRVYVETDRIPAAISEYKAGLSTDEDGSVHYLLARIYQKAGKKEAAAEAFKDSQRIRRQWDDRAHIAFGQAPTETGRP
jgi:tetratricopeptide (TPR) repeat protein